jgi:hypothetical protein
MTDPNLLRDIDLPTWRARARPGDHLAYHKGFLMSDRLGDPALAATADSAWKLYEEDRAILVQRRHGPGDYEYLIVARAAP